MNKTDQEPPQADEPKKDTGDDGGLSSLGVAERMRRSFLASDAADAGYQPMTRDEFLKTLDDNKPVMLLITKRLGVKDEDAEEFLRRGREFIAAMPEKSVFDDYGLAWTLQMQLNEIIAVCTEMSLPMQGGITIGATPLGAINAHQMRAFGDASIVELTVPLMRLCDLIAKVMANSIEYKVFDGKTLCRADSVAVKKRLETETWILDEWRRVITLFATHARPPYGNPGPEPRGTEAKNFRLSMTESMEIWAVAHEASHHALKHGTDESAAKNLHPHHQEYQADQIARYIMARIATRRNTPDNGLLFGGVGFALALGAVSLVDRAKAVLDTGSDIIPASASHPSMAERLAAIQTYEAASLPDLATRWGSDRQMFLDVFDIVWTMIKPDFEEMRRKGVKSIVRS